MSTSVMSGTEWHKFHRVLPGAPLSVAFQRIFKPGEKLIVPQGYVLAGLFYNKQGVPPRLYEPAERAQVNLLQFVPIEVGADAEKAKLEFRRKADPDFPVWCAAGRHPSIAFDEKEPFGFDCGRGEDYCQMAYPGLTGSFADLYIKVVARTGEARYYKVRAWHTGVEISVETTVVEEGDAPESLRVSGPSREWLL